MENSKRKIGRPKAVGQIGPLVLGGDGGRTKVSVELSAGTASELEDYVRWVELSSSLTTAEAAAGTVEFALRKVFQRDGLWQEHRRKGPRSNGASDIVPTPDPLSASLSPPAGSGVRPARPTES